MAYRPASQRSPLPAPETLRDAWSNYIASLARTGESDGDVYYFGALTFRDVPDMQGVPRVPGFKSRERAAEWMADSFTLRGARSVLVEEFGSANGRAHLHYLTRWPTDGWSVELTWLHERWQMRYGFTKHSEVGDFGRVARYCAKYLTKDDGRMWLDGKRI